MIVRFFFFLSVIGLFQCQTRKDPGVDKKVAVTQKPGSEIPVLCYHNIKSAIAHHAPELTVTDSVFHLQIKMLHDSGYHSITVDDLYNYLTKGSSLPAKPVMITFDDSHQEHFAIADKELKKYGFKGVYFVETIVLDKPNYLTRQEIKQLSDEGNTIACHTYDHPLVTKLKDDEWPRELDQPRKLLEQITGKPVDYFAYPYGAWNQRAVEELKKRGVKAAFQLSDQQSATDPLFTIRRIMVSDRWSTAKLNDEIHSAFNRRFLAYSDGRKSKEL